LVPDGVRVEVENTSQLRRSSGERLAHEDDGLMNMSRSGMHLWAVILGVERKWDMLTFSPLLVAFSAYPNTDYGI